MRKCFVCDEPKKPNSRFCKTHHPCMEAIKTQAFNKGEMEAFDQIFDDEAKCRAAMAQFAKDNPPGKRFRKSIIDWAQWKKAYGVRVSFLTRDTEKEMDETDFVQFETLKRRKTEVQARGEWQRMLADPKIERTGDGVDTKIWITMAKKRERVRENFEENQLVEGSKELKNLRQQELQDLKNFAHSSAASCASAFLNAAQQARTVAAEPSIEEGVKKGRRVSVAMAGPAAGSKYKKLIEPFSTSMGAIHTLMVAAQEAFQKFESDLHETSGGATGELKKIPEDISAYQKALSVNMMLHNLWLAEEVIDSTLDILADSPSPLVASKAASPSKSSLAGSVSSTRMPPWPSPSKADAGASPSKCLKEQAAEQEKHKSKDPITFNFVKSLKGLPPKYDHSKEYAKMYSWIEMTAAVSKMNAAETIEELDGLKKIWEDGFASAVLLKEQFKEAAKQMTSSIANEDRAKRRKDQQEQSRQCYRKIETDVLQVEH